MKAKTTYTLMTLLLMLLISACGGAGDPVGQQAGPVANISLPASGSTFTLDQETLITFNAADVKGIAQVELSIDGQPVMVEKVEPPVNSYTASHRWKASALGSHIIELRAFNVDGDTGDSSQVFITVEAGETTATGTAVAESPVEIVDTPTSAPPPAPDTATPVPDTPTPVPAATDTVAPPAAPSGPVVTTLTGLRVRSGPGTNYEVIGQAQAGQSLPILGRDQNNAWWQVEFPGAPGGRGWIAAGAEFSTATNAGNVPVVGAPPPPPPAAPTNTPVPPTPTAFALKPTIFNFTANRYNIALGESVELSWDLANARAAFLRYDDKEEGVVAPGRKTVKPGKTTKYILVARNEAGDTTAEVTIQVGNTTATPIAIYREGTSRLANDQYIDFDQGQVSSDSDDGADFRWRGEETQFVPRNSADGALLSRSYNDIQLIDCVNATYGQPISGIDGTGLITGCYITDEDRYGKFFVSEWDASGNLTIQWLTWTAKK
jgi:hypothetical protein